MYVQQFMQLGHMHYFPIIVCEEGMLGTKGKGHRACQILKTWPTRFECYLYESVQHPKGVDVSQMVAFVSATTSRIGYEARNEGKVVQDDLAHPNHVPVSTR